MRVMKKEYQSCSEWNGQFHLKYISIGANLHSIYSYLRYLTSQDICRIEDYLYGGRPED